MPKLDLNNAEEVTAFATNLVNLSRRHDNARHNAEGRASYSAHATWVRAATELENFALENRLEYSDGSDLTMTAENALLDLAVRGILAGDFPGWAELMVVGLEFDTEAALEALVRAGYATYRYETAPNGEPCHVGWDLSDEDEALFEDLFTSLPGDDDMEPLALDPGLVPA